MQTKFFKKIKEYLFVRHITKYSFAVGKLGYCTHTKNERSNFYVLIFGGWFNKWFLERIELVIWDKNNFPNEYLEGGFRKKFKEANSKFYSVFISSCQSCYNFISSQKPEFIVDCN